MKAMFTFCVIFTILTLATATDVERCPKSDAIKLEPLDISISNCRNGKCVLKQNTEVSIDMKFTPKRDFNALESDISGIILDVPLPFPGYHGTNACPFIYDAEGKNKVGCPVKNGTTYRYKNTFKVLRAYPRIHLTVHWGLRDKMGDAVCFELPAQIKA